MKSADFQLFIKKNNLTQKSVANYLEVSPTFMNQIAKGERPMPTDKLQKLLDHPTWDTSMLRPSPLPTIQGNTVQVGSINGNNNAVAGGNITPNTDKSQEGNLPAWLPTSKEEGEVEMVNAEEVPYVEKAIIESRELDLKSYIESGNAKTIIPQGLVQQGVDYARKIYSDAMAPDIREGDIVLCSFVPSINNLVDGDIYAIDTSKFGCVIRDIKHDGDEIILIARNHKYPDLRVKQSEILNVAIPMQLIRSTFSQRTDYSKIIRDKDERIDLLVNREFDHIRHTDKLLEQIDRVTAQQGKLIEALVDKK